jgi:hypothetical protein
MRHGWTPGRIIALAAGVVLAVVSVCVLGAGGSALWADQSRHTGYVRTGTLSYSTGSRAFASERMQLGWGWVLTGLIGQAEIRVTSATPARPVFVGVGPADRVAAYLSGSAYTTVTGTDPGDQIVHYGNKKPAPPRTAGFWAAQVTGTGTQTLRWTPRTGDWMIVAMNADGSPALTVRADAGVLAPWLFELGIELIVGGIVLGAVSAALIVIPVRMASWNGDR